MVINVRRRSKTIYLTPFLTDPRPNGRLIKSRKGRTGSFIESLLGLLNFLHFPSIYVSKRKYELLNPVHFSSGQKTGISDSNIMPYY